MTQEAFCNEIALGIKQNVEINPPGLGTLDIQFWCGNNTLTTAACLLSSAAMGCDRAGANLFATVTVVYPEHMTGITQSELAPFVEHFLSETFELDAVAEKAAYVLNRIELVPLKSEEDPLASLPSNNKGALIVLQAAALFGETLAENAPLPPQLYAFLERAILATAEHAVGMMIDAGGPPPTNLSEIDSIMKANHVAVLTSVIHPPTDNNIAEHQARWKEMLEAEGVQAVIQDISDTKDVPEPIRELLKCSYMVDAGQFANTRVNFSIHEESFEKLDTGNALVATRVATKVGNLEFAKRVLTARIAELETDKHFEIACSVAEQLPDQTQLNAIVDNWRSANPQSKALHLRKVSAALIAHDYDTVADRLAAPPISDLARSGMWRWFSEKVVTIGSDAPLTLIRDFRTSFPDHEVALQNALIRLLADRKRRGDALKVIADLEDGDLSVRRAYRVTSIIELGVLDADQEISLECISEWIPRLFAVLACNPQNLSLRAAIMDLFEPELLGQSGLPLLIHAVASRLQLAETETVAHPLVNSAQPDEISQVKDLFESGFEWLSAQPPSRIGETTMPSTVLPISSSGASAILIRIIQEEGTKISQESDIDYLHRLVMLGAAIAPIALDPCEDITMATIAAGKMAQAGYKQQARDFAENIIILGSQTAKRRRLAWYGYADVYARCGNRLKALAALVAATYADDAADWRQIWNETYLTIRLFRDCGLIDPARELIPRAREAMRGAGLGEQYESRLATIDLSLKFLVFKSHNEPDSTNLISFLHDCVSALGEVQAIDDETGPLAAMIVQSIALAKMHGLAIPKTADTAAENLLCDAPGRFADLLNELRLSTPSLEQLVASFMRTSAPRYASDVGFDFFTTELLAKKLLSDEASIASPEATLYATEVLADRAFIGLTGDKVKTTNIMGAAATPLHAAQTLARPGCDLVFLGVGSSQLVATKVVAAELATIQIVSADDFDIAAFKVWNESYPARYGDDCDSSVFLSSTAQLSLQDLPAKAVIIADSRLQALPVNLIQIDGALAGLQHKLAAAPSLSWLAASRLMQHPHRQSRRAWLPGVLPQAEGEPFQAIQLIRDNLKDAFDEHEVRVETGPVPSVSNVGDELLIIAAHGGLTASNAYFRTVIDEEGQVLLSAQSFAKKFNGADVAILFVCSAGRVDSHPGANSTIGLVREFLARGCRSVIAPPWALEAVVAKDWLPVFLERWDAGDDVLDSCFSANRAIAELTSYDFKRALAMTVFGDPLVTKNRR